MTSFAAMTTQRMMMYANSSEGESFSRVEIDVDKFLQQKNDEFAMLVLPAMVFLAILFVIGVSGNSMVLYVYNRKLHKGTIRWFVQALAIFDLLSCLVAIPGEIIDMRNNYTFGSSPMCKVLRTVSMFCTVSSGITLMVVAVERYKRICTPLRKQITPKGAQLIIAVSAVVASICAAPACLIYGPQTTPTNLPHINGTDCSTADVFMDTLIPLAFSLFQILLFLLGALGLIVLYSLIGRKVWSHAHFRRAGFNAGINRRISLIFSGSDCSSPTTDDLVFAFPAKKPPIAVAEAEENSNTSLGNNGPQDNNNVTGKDGDVTPTQNPAIVYLPYQGDLAASEVQDMEQHPGTGEDGSEKQAAQEDLPNGVDEQPSLPKPSTPGNTEPAFESLRKPRPTSKPVSRERVKSGDSTLLKGRFRRRSTQHTLSDRRRFLHRSDSVNSGTRRTTLMLFLITLVYLLSFLPYLVLTVLKSLDEDSLSGRGGAWELVHNILLRSYFINSMINPIIYSFCSRGFRKECSKVIHCRCCRSPMFVY